MFWIVFHRLIKDIFESNGAKINAVTNFKLAVNAR